MLSSRSSNSDSNSLEYDLNTSAAHVLSNAFLSIAFHPLLILEFAIDVQFLFNGYDQPKQYIRLILRFSNAITTLFTLLELLSARHQRS